MRDRFSTAIFCDFCGNGRNEVADMVAAPTAHICDGCVDLAISILTARRATRTDKAEVGRLSPIDDPIDFKAEARGLLHVISPTVLAPDHGPGVEKLAAAIIEGNMRAIASLAVNSDRRRRQCRPNGALNG